jgi:tetratricopeptide (TPR) repeat protein
MLNTIKAVRKLKHFFFVCLFLLYIPQNIFAADVENKLQKGNEYYQSGKFFEAIETYEEIINEGYEGTSLYYNLGNAYYRIGKLGKAIVNYERALNLSPRDEDVRHNLVLANTQIKDKIEAMPNFFIFDWWESLLAFFSLNGWAYISYIMWLLFLIAAGFYFYTSNPLLQKKSFYGGMVLMMLFFFSVSITAIKLKRETNIKRGVVIESIVNVKMAPDEKSSDAFLIHEGLKVKVEDSLDKWLKIRLEDGKVGWLQDNTLEII